MYCSAKDILKRLWVRCDTWLYRFLIFAPLLTFLKKQTCTLRRNKINNDRDQSSNMSKASEGMINWTKIKRKQVKMTRPRGYTTLFILNATIVGILTFISMINATSEGYKAFIFSILVFTSSWKSCSTQLKNSLITSDHMPLSQTTNQPLTYQDRDTRTQIKLTNTLPHMQQMQKAEMTKHFNHGQIYAF